MRKFLAAVLSVLCMTCLCLAMTSCLVPKYYILTYDAIGGVTFDFGDIQSGAQVKSGYEVKFTCSADESRVTGEPTVLINGEDVYPDLDGVYSFIMTRNTEVSVTGVYAISTFDITFDKEDWWVTYLDADTGEELSVLEDVSAGTKVEFILNVSVYYDRESDFDVLANTTVVKPDENGVYSFTAARQTTVKVTGLELEESFLSRENGGEGTADKPFLIERPIDLYVMADYVNNAFYSGHYGMCYYKLNADIDMEGEQLFIIGDTTTSTAVFCGNFNGNNHKISNYYISDTIVEQSEFSTVFMPYIGLFGMAAATNAAPASIYDLTLENFTIKVNADRFNTMFAAGGIVGAGVGVDITNCHVSGSITADADDNYYAYIGGIVGFLQSAYNSDTERALASVVGCSANVNLVGQSGYLYAAGGIAGYVYSYEENTPAYIVNSYSKGTVSGAMNAGGIAGYMSPYSSVKNCYALGVVDAYNGITPTPGFTEYAYAYAGGIAGYVERDGVVSGCFSLASVYASAYSSQYEKKGSICGGLSEGGGEYIECAPALMLNCTDNASNINQTYLTGTLGWLASEWSFDGAYPEYIGGNGAKNIAVTLSRVTNNNAVDGSQVINLSANGYLPMAEWYNSDLHEFITLNSASDGTWRSYGYYFDRSLTQKVPRGYVPTGSETLYYGLADYASVSGVYYLQTSEKGSGIYIELKDDGTLVYRDRALNLTTTYIYDGVTLTLFACPAFTEVVTNADGSESSSYYYTSGQGAVSGGVLRLVNNISYTSSSPLIAVKKLENFLYGGYYGTNNTECVFNTDGTGTLNGAPITYTVAGNTIVINGSISGTVNAVNRTVTIGNAVYTAYDPFRGTWEKSATTHIEFTFDGKNVWTYTYYGYIDGVKSVLQSDSGTYTFDNTDTLTLNGGTVISNGTKATFDENGFIKLTSTDLTLYKQFSAVGTWRYFYKDEAIEITFNGIGSGGYGTASISYETVTEDLEVTYHAQNVLGTDYIYLFLEDTLLGILHYDVDTLTLRGMIYSYAEDEMLGTYYVYADELDGNGNLVILATYTDTVAFCLYDEFGGQWMSSEWGVVEFNGYGSYELSSLIIKEERNKILTLPVSGVVTIGQKTGTYKLDNSTMEGTLVFDGATYRIAYDRASDTIKVSGGTDFSLYRPDGMNGIQLKGADGKIYSFDGGSAIPGGGKVTVSDGSAVQTYKYTMSGTSITITGLGTITVSNDRYILSGVTLTVVNGFTGEWHVGGTFDKLVIGEIGASNKAAGTYLGTNVTFTHNVAEDYLSFTYKNTTYYIFAKIVQGGESAAVGYELIISTVPDMTQGVNNVYCLSTSVETDEFRGTYTNADGKYIEFDGLSVLTYGYGTAKIQLEGATAVYSYSINSFGMAYIAVGNYIVKAVPEGTEGAYSDGIGHSYILVKPDSLYLRSAKGDEGIYTFDGIDTVVCGDKTYSYIINENDKLALAYKLTLKDADGTYSAEVGYGSTEYAFRFVDELTDITVLVGDISYSFVSAGKLTATDISEDEPEPVVYTYVIDDYKEDYKTYFLKVTDGAGKEHNGVLVIGADGKYTFTLDGNS